MVHCMPYIYVSIIPLCSCLISVIRTSIEYVPCLYVVYIVTMTVRRGGRDRRRIFPFPSKFCWLNNYIILYDYSIPHELKKSPSEAM